jgi:hypothetical protein
VKWGFLVGLMIPEKVFHQILALGEAWRVSRESHTMADTHYKRRRSKKYF